MSEIEKRIINNFKELVPDLTDVAKEKLISFTEGMRIMKDSLRLVEPGGENHVREEQINSKKGC